MTSTAATLRTSDYIRGRRSIATALTLLIVSQRFGLHIGGFELSSSFIFAVVLIACAYRFGLGALSAGRMVVWACLAILVAASVAGAASGGKSPSVASALAFLVSASMLTLRSTRGSTKKAGCQDAILGVFLVLGGLVSGLVAVQWIVELTSGHYFDPVELLPKSFLVSGYNTHAVLNFGSSVSRPNGVVFLEPSVASQFLGLAAVIALVNPHLAARTRRTMLLVLLAGLLMTASGTGFIVFAAGWLLATRPLRAIRAIAASLVVLSLALAFTNPQSTLRKVTSERIAEATRPSGSGHSRFVLPYQTVFREAAPQAYDNLVGNGPGAADMRAEMELESTGRHELFNTLLKLYWEYGAFATLLFVTSLLLIARRVRHPGRAVVWASLIQYLLLTGSLVSPFEPALIGLIAAAFESDPTANVAQEFLAARRRTSVVRPTYPGGAI